MKKCRHIDIKDKNKHCFNLNLFNWLLKYLILKIENIVIRNRVVIFFYDNFDFKLK